MHRVDTDGHVGNLFDEGDPGVPRLPTVIDSEIMNAFQEEIAGTVEAAGITLIKNTNTQLKAAVVKTGKTVETMTGKLVLTEPASGSVADPLLAVNAHDASGTKAATMQGAPDGGEAVLTVTHNGSADGDAIAAIGGSGGGAAVKATAAADTSTSKALEVAAGVVKFGSANPASADGHTNVLSPLGLVKGWAHFAWANAAPTLASGMNMAAPGNPAAGQIQVNLTDAIASGHMVCIGVAGPGQGYKIVPLNGTGLLQLEDQAGAAIAFGATTGFAYVAVLGRQ